MTTTEQENQRVEIGIGKLSWARGERISDRYGTVGLYDDNDIPIPLIKIEPGVVGRLVAIILETRESHHIGDFARGMFPITPNIGDEIILGTGHLFYKYSLSEKLFFVGLKPLDGRNVDWLSPDALYRCHDQTVELFFEPSGGD